MSSDDTATAALLDDPGDRDALTAPYAVLPVDGVSISTLVSPFGAETVSASDAAAAHCDEIQLDLGEGPVWQAVGTGSVVCAPDLAATAADAWPAALSALREAGVGSVFAFPMRIGRTCIGTVGLYADHPVALPPRSVSAVAALAHATSRAVLHLAVGRAESEEPGEWRSSEYSRREIHQAVGMVAAQTGTSPDEAILLLRAAAFAAGRSVRAVAVDVLDRVTDLSDAHDLDSPERNQP